MQPEIDIFGFELKTFGLMFALNFVAWGAIAARRFKELGRPSDWAWELVIVALAGGFVGARLYWIAQNWDEAGDDLLGSVVSGSGLIWYGGLAGGALAVYVWAKRKSFWTPQLLDFAAVGLPVGYAIGRIGCQLSGDGDYGGPSSLPWAMPFPDGTVPTTDEVHPSPLYETLFMGTVGFLLWQIRDRVRPGVLFAFYLVIAGLERFFVEFVRRNEDVFVGLTAAQLESLALAALGVIVVLRMRRKGPLFADSYPGRVSPATA